MRRSTQGFTLIEVLISVVIATLLLTSLAAFFAISSIKRLQSQRLNQAAQLAQSQINEVSEFWQTFDSQGISYFDHQAMVFAWSDEYFDHVNTTNNQQTLTDPSAIAPNSRRIPPSLRIIPVDTDADGTADYLAQVFVGDAPGAPPGELKRLVVRIFEKQTLIEDLDQTPVVALRPLIYGSNEAFVAQGLTAPLVVLVADISRPESPL